MKVLKFGGTSLANATQIKKVCDIILSDPERRIVVVSAPGKRFDTDIKVTDLLIAMAKAILDGKDARAELQAVVTRFSDITDGLGIPDELPPLQADLESLLSLDTSHPGKFTDALKAAGEDTTAKLVAAYLRRNGHAARYIHPGKAGMRLTDEFGNARLLEESYEALASLKDLSGLVIFPGFFGTTAQGDVATFPRGGSDITGAILAAAVQADVYENFTDTEYVYSAHPKVIKGAEPILEITYREMRELSSAGFEIYQEEALLPVYKRGIAVNIRSVNNPSCPGTRIVANRVSQENKPVVGIANDSDICCLYVSKYLMNREIGFGRRVLQILEEAGISYDHTPTGIDDMSVIFKRSLLTEERKAVIMERLYAELHVDNAYFDLDLAMITVAGEGMSQSIGVAARATAALSRAGINIEMISQGCSEVSMVFAVRLQSELSAIRALYDEFFRAP